MQKPVESPFNYSYIPGVAQYSGGVIAHPGHELVRVRFLSTPELNRAFERIEEFLGDRGVPTSSVCAFEMRSPGQFTEETFREFNESYTSRLDSWGSLLGDDKQNPVARSNVIPHTSGLSGPSVHAFTYVCPTENPLADSTFVIAGSAEAPEGKGSYADNAIAFGDTSTEGIRKKSDWVMGEMLRRLQVLGQGWDDVTDAQVYTKLPYLEAHETLARQLRTSANITWHFANPPVEGLVFEMDCRRINVEEVAA